MLLSLKVDKAPMGMWREERWDYFVVKFIYSHFFVKQVLVKELYCSCDLLLFKNASRMGCQYKKSKYTIVYNSTYNIVFLATISTNNYIDFNPSI